MLRSARHPARDGGLRTAGPSFKWAKKKKEPSCWPRRYSGFGAPQNSLTLPELLRHAHACGNVAVPTWSKTTSHVVPTREKKKAFSSRTTPLAELLAVLHARPCKTAPGSPARCEQIPRYSFAVADRRRLPSDFTTRPCSCTPTTTADGIAPSSAESAPRRL